VGGGTASLIVSKMSISPIVGLFRRVCAEPTPRRALGSLAL
jgi:hypothetical protein